MAAALVVAAIMAGCGQARHTAAPEPEFVRGERAEPTALPVATVAAGGDEISLEDIEADIASDDDTTPVDVGGMFIVDDAGDVQPNRSGWETFDAEMARRLIPADWSASVTVSVDGQLVHQGAYGERVPGTGEVTEVTDRFRIASISKTITAIVTMQLVDDGTLTLDDPVGDQVAAHLGLTSYDPDVDSITVRELLSHTAGFPQHEGTFFSNGATSCTDAAAKGLSNNVGSGNGFRYSNMSYCVLGILIESVTGMTYERVVADRLLTPLGISGMRFTGTYELGPDEVSHQPVAGRNYMETLAAAGSWNATPTDLVTIINSINPNTGGWKALSPESMAMMRYRVPTGAAPSGYGLGIINYSGDTYGHTGTIENTHAMVLVQPNGVTWAVTVAGGYPGSTGNLRGIVNAAFTAAF